MKLVGRKNRKGGAMQIGSYTAITLVLALWFSALESAANAVVAAPKISASFNTFDASKRALKSTEVPLEIKLARRKVIVIDGKETTQNAITAKPGDMLEDVATYTNKSGGVLKVPQVSLPVPQNTEIILNSVKPASAFASTDGVNFSPIPLMTKVKQANGVEVEQSAALSQYRFLRWYPGQLAAGQSLVYSTRFKVSDGFETTIVKR